MKTYNRDDRALKFVSVDESAEVFVDGERKHVISRELLDAAAIGRDTDLLAFLDHAELLPPRDFHYDDTISRVTIQVGERGWARIAWESFTPAAVRISSVRPRVLQIPLSFPIRILEAGGNPVVKNALASTFYESDYSLAIVEAFTEPSAVASFPAAEHWPTVEILHLREIAPAPLVGWLQPFVDRYQTRLVIIETEAAQMPDLREAAQTLVDRGGPAIWLVAEPVRWDWVYGNIIHDRPLDWTRASAYLAGALFAGHGREDALRYSRLAEAFRNAASRADITDEIDKSGRMSLDRFVPGPIYRDYGAVYEEGTAGAAECVREAILQSVDSLRIPRDEVAFTTYDINVGQSHTRKKAVRLNAAISKHLIERGFVAPGLEERVFAQIEKRPHILIDDLTSEIASQTTSIKDYGFGRTRDFLSVKLTDIADLSPQLEYEDSESEGMLPLAAKVAEARSLLHVLRGDQPRALRPPRTVNAAFFTSGADGEDLAHIEQSELLRPGEPVQLGIRIGEQDRLTVTLGSTALLEEVFRAPEGTWIEIGVTAIDFDLEGDAVQRVWLPATEGTDLITFTMRPRGDGAVPGIARLRFSLFRDNNVVQSFLMAAMLSGAEADRTTGLARALGVDAEEVVAVGENVRYLMRLEYSGASIPKASSVKGRSLSIIANDIAGQKVVTIKGEELFSVSTDPLLPEKVKKARETLEAASANEKRLYRYMFGKSPNAGDPDRLCDVLSSFAERGWQIYNTLVRSESGQKNVRERVERGGGIHAAHIDASTTIPWTLVYDRQFRERAAKNIGGVERDVTRALCRASMPNADGTMPAVECGGAGCLLDPAENARRIAANQPIVLEETVVCPRRFWGFMFPIDVPAQQVSKIAGQEPPEIQEEIKAARPVNIVFGSNPNLSFQKKHRQELDTLAKGQALIIPPHADGREALIDVLDDRAADADIVYFYCHAVSMLQAANGRSKGPALDFGHGYDKNVLDDTLEAAEFHGKEWSRSPLVFMNGCANVAFSPYAPSEFIKQFIQGRMASAVVGTEVTVWEVLAGEFARVFFSAFLDRKTNAGEALLSARRVLLAKNNPLGLVYTLFGSARLKIAP